MGLGRVILRLLGKDPRPDEAESQRAEAASRMAALRRLSEQSARLQRLDIQVDAHDRSQHKRH